ncbi:MAG: 4Fe-4S binding protein [Verrucomicrobiia bacterium]
MIPRFSQIPWRFWRRATQVVCLLLFLWLFRKTEYTGIAGIPGAANILFRIDPLVAASVMVAAKRVVLTVLWSMILVALTVVLGRFFCGWICPLGTLLDGARRLVPTRFQARPLNHRWQHAKYFLLGVILISAALGLPLVGYFDPFSILMRGLTCAIDPLWNHGVSATFTWLYQHAPAAVTSVTEPIYAFLKKTVLPFQGVTFRFAGPAVAGLVILLAVFALEFVQRRFWCRYVCPLGGLLALLSRWSLVRRLPVKSCKDCGVCGKICRMDAFDAEGRLAPEACNLCGDCIDECPQDRVRFIVRKTRTAPTPLDQSRRLFIGTVATGFALPVVAWVGRINRRIHPQLIRPPGAGDESAFLDRCVRCGECLKVCPTNALQPTMLEAGVEGMFSPRLVPRIGYCEYNCTLCGEICPTGAIRRLPLAKKQETVIGKAKFYKDRCLPYAKGKNCGVCEEHCPVPEKAIRFREAEARTEQGEKVIVKQPYVERDLCIGCGICENKCPLEGPAAVRVSRVEVAA